MADEGRLGQLVQRIGRARELAALAVAQNPDDVRALFGAAMAYLNTGDYASARAPLRRAVQLQPYNTHFHFELGRIEEYLGEFEAAARSYARAIQATPENYKARQALVQLQKQSLANNSIRELEALFAGPDADGWRTLHIGHALAKTYEDLGDLQKSMEWLGRAKQARRKLYPYQPAREEALAKAAINAPAPGSAAGFVTEEPIFVAGLPRSGTTLVDRILSSHPEVSSAGEIGNFTALFKALSGSTTPFSLDPDTFGRAGGIDFERLGRLYIDSTRPLTGVRPRFIDKAPSNYIQAGMILKALPNARIVCMRRHPLDSVLSNYKQIFPIDDRYYDYVYALESAAHKAVQFDRMANHWRAALPADRFMVLQYEDLVVNQEEQTRALLRFCGLSWDERCLSFHQNAAGVGTPSAAQVRAPMSTAAVRRWEKYGALLEPARRVLAKAGVL